jgi:hypothetical protein
MYNEDYRHVLKGSNIYILSDSRAAIKAFDSFQIIPA